GARVSGSHVDRFKVVAVEPRGTAPMQRFLQDAACRSGVGSVSATVSSH
ncbi:hypothetical protein GWI33_010462, partial [Rhynchophorus ferrugineus]